MSHGEYPERDAQLFYELTRDHHASQATLLDALDSKLGLFLSASSALVGILIAVYALRPDSFGTPELVVGGLSCLAWLALTCGAVFALWRHQWFSGPKVPFVYGLHLSGEADQRLKWRVASAYWRDYKCNRKYVDRKARALTVVLVLFVAQTVLLVAALGLVARSESDTTPHSEYRDREARPAARSAAVPALARTPVGPGPAGLRSSQVFGARHGSSRAFVDLSWTSIRCRSAIRLLIGGMRMRGLEPPRGCPHTDLNRARLPIPPHPPGRAL
jgi:hypothetical protein